eukprot:1944146-Rhodomonas_salina.1
MSLRKPEKGSAVLDMQEGRGWRRGTRGGLSLSPRERRRNGGRSGIKTWNLSDVLTSSRCVLSVSPWFHHRRSRHDMLRADFGTQLDSQSFKHCHVADCA